MSKKSQKDRKSRKIPIASITPADAKSENELETRSISPRTLLIIVIGLAFVLILFITKPSQAPLPEENAAILKSSEPSTTNFKSLDTTQLGPIRINPSSLQVTPFFNSSATTNLQK